MLTKYERYKEYLRGRSKERLVDQAAHLRYMNIAMEKFLIERKLEDEFDDWFIDNDPRKEVYTK